jgi:hypothetical protein
VLVFWISHEVHGHVFDDGHVLRSVLAAQAGEIVLHNQIGRSSTAAWHRVRIVMDTRQAAESLCARLQSSGEQCLVQRVYGDLEK